METKVTPVAVQGAIIVPKKPQTAVAVRFKPEEFVTIGETVKHGLISLPKLYDVKAAMLSMYTKLISNEAGNLLEICTAESIQDGIKTVVTNAWNPEKGHCCFYPATYKEGALQGQKYLVVQRMVSGGINNVYNSGNVVSGSILANAIFKGDIFEDKKLPDGRTIIVKHERPKDFESRSDEVIGAYATGLIIIGGKALRDAEVLSRGQLDRMFAIGKDANIAKRKAFPEQFARRSAKSRFCGRLMGWTQEQQEIFMSDETLDVDDINNIPYNTAESPTSRDDAVYDVSLDGEDNTATDGNTTAEDKE